MNDDDDIPPVLQFPVARTVKMRFVHAGKHQPLPFPEDDMTERESMLAAAHADPSDHASRLVLADWLDEHGEHQLARTYRWAGKNRKFPAATPEEQSRTGRRYNPTYTDGWTHTESRADQFFAEPWSHDIHLGFGEFDFVFTNRPNPPTIEQAFIDLSRYFCDDNSETTS